MTFAPDIAGARLTALETATAAAMGVFEASGFARIVPGQLLSAENLLDLYGEDVRARAFVFPGGAEGDLCLRPDLTLPICRHHLQTAEVGEARYAAAGPVFRRAISGDQRASEFQQVGCEWFGAANTADAEARVFRLTLDALAAIGVTAHKVITGDVGIIYAMIEAAPIPARWQARLKRHIWRPVRFRQLLTELTEKGDSDPGRIAFLKAIGSLEPPQARAAVERMLSISDTTHVGLRTHAEIAERFLEQAEDSRAHPVSEELVAAIEAAARLKAPCAQALTQLADLSRAAQLDISPALAHFEQRLERLSGLGVDVAALPFDGEFGRNLEYYDGFVFEIFDAGLEAREGRRAAQLAGGGRYDGMLPAAALAFGRSISAEATAIGAAIRPQTALAVAGGAI